eukprot:TRINITY_DN3952_c0_g1_i1.p1 TRINITY_DN3952_c0_g1~~TRINITY_DN3952_c0_g1_i1.p1  ORF type:complete len:1188 (-),score=347.34 TRINITY_DN3952_c0_g1_i1:100-3630(-)
MGQVPTHGQSSTAAVDKVAVQRKYGYPRDELDDAEKAALISMMLAVHDEGSTACEDVGSSALMHLARDLVLSYHEKTRLLATIHGEPPVAHRVEAFLNAHLAEVLAEGERVSLPSNTLVLPAHGVARALSLPARRDHVESPMVSSYTVLQGVLHNPLHDRRTTEGSFHVAEGGLPITADKLRVPKGVFANLLRAALSPPADMTLLPFTADFQKPVHSVVSLLLRPVVGPATGRWAEKTLEIVCYAPGSLVSNLDFLESIFGNAGDPFLPENDAALDPEHWSGHTGCIILAPHLTTLTKREVGLPRWEDATPLQRTQGMCWRKEDERYNGGNPFKVVCRTAEGVYVTLLADNYYGYSKKEVKSQISYACNLAGVYEEEHSGGAIAFPRYSYGLEVETGTEASRWPHLAGYTFADAMELCRPFASLQREGYAIDRNYPDVLYVPGNCRFSLITHSVEWDNPDGTNTRLKIVPSKVYILPSGFKIQMEKHPAAPAWRLLGTEAVGVRLHKPCTVSGGGKSELSKSISGHLMYGPLFIADPEKDFAMVDAILNSDRYMSRFRDGAQDARPLLAADRTLGSVIKMVTPSADDFTDEYNAWLASFPPHIWPIVFYVKRFYKPEWADDWRAHFSMDMVNGRYGNEVKFENRKIMAGFLRVGFNEAGLWRTYKTRIDFIPALKVQTEDDISASATVPAAWVPHVKPAGGASAFKMSSNCEYRLFQRPDDCVHRGLDAQCESDLAGDGNFLCNFEPLKRKDAIELVTDTCDFELFTPPMQGLIRRAAAASTPEYFVSSAHTRLVGQPPRPTSNPRYLQTRPDVLSPMDTYVSEIGYRLHHRIPADRPAAVPVDLLLIGRRISRPQPGLPNLAVFNPIHYQELPEFFADVICGMSGTSPSTTGAGSEGALTKGPFNSLPFTIDVGNLLVSCILAGLGGWSTPTGCVGPRFNFAHDVSLIAPEVFGRMKPEERDPAWLIERGYLKRVADFEYEGRTVPASRLGYRITPRFAHFLGRVFDHPIVFDEAILKPEKQGLAEFAAGVDELVTAQRVIAQRYFDDDTVNFACPPLKALLYIMARGSYEGKGLDHPDIRRMFTPDYLLSSDWYMARLRRQQELHQALWARNVALLTAYVNEPINAWPVSKLKLQDRLRFAQEELAFVSRDDYVDKVLMGTIGADTAIPAMADR